MYLYIVTLLVYFIFYYLLFGIVFSVFLLIGKGLSRIDEVAYKSNKWFKFMIVPGCIILWPILFNKWKASKKSNTSI